MKSTKFCRLIAMMLIIALCINTNPISVKAANMTISNTGLNLIKSFEGCCLTAYKAVQSEEYYTIGWGIMVRMYMRA